MSLILLTHALCRNRFKTIIIDVDNQPNTCIEIPLLVPHSPSLTMMSSIATSLL